jgi:hypothetical protein
MVGAGGEVWGNSLDESIPCFLIRSGPLQKFHILLVLPLTNQTQPETQKHIKILIDNP